MVESDGLAEVEIATGKVVRRTPVPGSRALNDIAVAVDGSVYLSDSLAHTLFRVAGGNVEAWLKGPEIERPNGLHLVGGRLVVGNNGDGRLKSVDLSTKEVRTVADLGTGIIDGIESDANGNLLVSHFEGRLFRVTPAGEVTKLLDTSLLEIPVRYAQHGIQPAGGSPAGRRSHRPERSAQGRKRERPCDCEAP